MFLRVFDGSIKGVLKQFQGSFWKVAGKSLGVLCKIQDCFMSLSRNETNSRNHKDFLKTDPQEPDQI